MINVNKLVSLDRSNQLVIRNNYLNQQMIGDQKLKRETKGKVKKSMALLRLEKDLQAFES